MTSGVPGKTYSRVVSELLAQEVLAFQKSGASTEMPVQGFDYGSLANTHLGQQRIRAVARYSANSSVSQAAFEALAAKQSPADRDVRRFLTETDEGRALCLYLGGTSGGRDLGRIVLTTSLWSELVGLLSSNAQRPDEIWELVRSDLGRKISDFLAYTKDGRALAQDMVDEMRFRAVAGRLGAGGKSRKLCESFGSGRAGGVVAAHIREDRGHSQLVAEFGQVVVAGAVIAVAAFVAHIGMANLVVSTAISVSSELSTAAETATDPTPMPEVRLVDQFDETDAWALYRHTEAYLAWVTGLIQDGVMSDEDAAFAQYAISSYAREWRENPAGPDPQAALHWLSRLLGLSTPYAPGEGRVRAVGEKIGEMASSAPEAQPDLAIEAVELVGEIEEPDASRERQRMVGASRVGWVVSASFAGAGSGVTLVAELSTLAPGLGAILGAVIGVLTYLFMRVDIE